MAFSRYEIAWILYLILNHKRAVHFSLFFSLSVFYKNTIRSFASIWFANIWRYPRKMRKEDPAAKLRVTLHKIDFTKWQVDCATDGIRECRPVQRSNRIFLSLSVASILSCRVTSKHESRVRI